MVKYEIENFKDQLVTLDVVEDIPYIRGEVRGNSGRDVQWELGNQTTFTGGPDAQRSTFERVVFHVQLPARNDNGSTEKVVHKLHLILKNEW